MSVYSCIEFFWHHLNTNKIDVVGLNFFFSLHLSFKTDLKKKVTAICSLFVFTYVKQICLWGMLSFSWRKQRDLFLLFTSCIHHPQYIYLSNSISVPFQNYILKKKLLIKMLNSKCYPWEILKCLLYGVEKFILSCKFMYESIRKSLSKKLMIQTMTS